jgi:hypothetical protein
MNICVRDVRNPAKHPPPPPPPETRQMPIPISVKTWQEGLHEGIWEARHYIGGLVLAGVIGAAVYFLYWKPRRKQRQLHKQQLAEEQARLVQEIQRGTADAAGVAGSLQGAMKDVATVGLAEARQTEAALQLADPVETTWALTGVVEWSRRQLRRVWQGFKDAFAHVVNVTTRFARRVWPSRFPAPEPAVVRGEAVVPPVHVPAQPHHVPAATAAAASASSSSPALVLPRPVVAPSPTPHARATKPAVVRRPVTAREAKTAVVSSRLAPSPTPRARATKPAVVRRPVTARAAKKAVVPSRRSASRGHGRRQGAPAVPPRRRGPPTLAYRTVA